MRLRSLRWRLLAGGAAAVFAALAVAWIVMGYLFEAHLERAVETELIEHGRDLVAGLNRNPAGALIVDPAPSDPRFQRPSSGFYWQVNQGALVLRSRSMWDETIAPRTAIGAGEWTLGHAAGPFGQELVFVARRVTLNDAEAPITVLLGADRARVSAARGVFSRDLAIFLALLWAVLSGAAWLQVRLGLQPLRDVGAALTDLESNSAARLTKDDYPDEAAPLALAINRLADARQKDLERAHHRAADLAHSLKTPLAAIAAQGRKARDAGAGDAADGLDRAIEAAHAAVERELSRARISLDQGPQHTPAGALIDRLIGVVARTEGGERLTFSNALGGAELPVGAVTLMELAGPLLENAARFARTRVRISGDTQSLIIDDDGPGLSEADAAVALERGRRLDETARGHGLGLAIARDAAELSGGELLLSRSDLGGLRAEVRWKLL